MIKMIFSIILIMVCLPIFSEWDILVSHYFFEKDSFSNHKLWSFFFDYGPLPALITVGAAFFGFIASYFIKKAAAYRKIFLLLILTLLIGSGLIAHAILKDNWGRARPRQITEFGGIYPFTPFYQPVVHNLKSQEKLRSFPCGHCTMGFYFFSVALAFQRLGRKKLAFAAFAFALILGGFLSLARIAMGGHFLSDTLVSFLIMGLTSLSLDTLLFRKGETIAHI